MQKGIDNRFICTDCGNPLPETKFIKSKSGFYAGVGHLPICKDCFSREYEKYKIFYNGNSSKAMRRMCMAFDIYFDESSFEKCVDEDGASIGTYIKNLNLGQNKGKTFDTTLSSGIFDSLDENDDGNNQSEEEQPTIDPKLKEKWGDGFSDIDYKLLDEHYRLLKSSNPKCDDNQEIFIIDLCYTKMQQMRAVRESRVDDYNKLTESYRKTFTQAGLKTVQENTVNDDDCWGVWQARIAKYTPEEYYKNKKLYKDFDGLQDYIERFVLRPLRNLMFGTQDRDKEYYVHDESEDVDDSYADSEETL